MKCLVIIPTTMHNLSFSAPLAWLFSNHIDNVKGIFGFELTKELVKNHDLFILELNWFIELAEFKLLVEYIKKHNPHSRILFGGLYASLKYKDVFRQFDVDYFIQGDNELPMQMFLDSVNPREIPNLIGRNFENPVTYMFKEEDFYDLDFNLDWFPSYYRYIEQDQLYQLPMIITSKGGCSSAHSGCDYCMGSKHEELRKIYNRPPIVMSNDSLMHILGKIEKKFDDASLMLLSRYDYDFSDKHFDLGMNVEIDSRIPSGKIKDILYAFKKCVLNIPVYAEGLSGESIEHDFEDIIQLEDENHKVKFFAYIKDAVSLNIPEDHRLYSEDVLPDWAYWDYYMDMGQAARFSEVFFFKLDENRKFAPQE